MTGDGSASEDFDCFYQRTRAGLLAKAIMACGHLQDAQDAVSEAYLEASKRWDRLRDFDSPEGWVYKIMVQRLIKARRPRTTDRELLRWLPPPRNVSPAQTAMAREVLRALARLPRAQRTAMALRTQEMTQDEIAQLMGVSRGAVASYIHTARHALCAALCVEYGAALPALLEDGLVAAGHTAAEAGTKPDPAAEILRDTGAWLRHVLDNGGQDSPGASR